MNTTRQIIGLIITLATPLMVLRTAHAANPLPRYKLQPGQEFVYESSDSEKTTHSSFSDSSRLTYWVISQAPNGHWHIIAENQNENVQNNCPAQKREFFGAFDLSPDGTASANSNDFREQFLQERLRGPFVLLPKDSYAASTGWEQPDGPGRTFVYGPIATPTAGICTINRTSKGIFDTIYLGSYHDVVQFDTERGYITKITGEYSQGVSEGTEIMKTELKSVQTRDPAWIQKLAAEAESWFQASKPLQKAIGSSRDSGSMDNTLDAAKVTTEAARNTATLPVIQAQYDQLLGQIPKLKTYLSRNNQTLLNKPAPDWTAAGLDGGQHKLSEYLGKVVVLDFWYRRCGWCMVAMPQINEVADHFRDKPVAILGMCKDHNEADAKFVAEKLALKYPVIKAEGIPEKYGVEGFPTLFVIDPRGIVRKRDIGYSPTLRDDLIKTIDSLLAETAR